MSGFLVPTVLYSKDSHTPKLLPHHSLQWFKWPWLEAPHSSKANALTYLFLLIKNEIEIEIKITTGVKRRGHPHMNREDGQQINISYHSYFG